MQFAGLDHHPLFGLSLDEAIVLPGGDRQQQQGHGERGDEKPAQGPSQAAPRARLDRVRTVSAAAAEPAEDAGSRWRAISVDRHRRCSAPLTGTRPPAHVAGCHRGRKASILKLHLQWTRATWSATVYPEVAARSNAALIGGGARIARPSAARRPGLREAPGLPRRPVKKKETATTEAVTGDGAATASPADPDARQASFETGRELVPGSPDPLA